MQGDNSQETFHGECKELLIRIDERQKHMHRDVQYIRSLTEELDDRVHKLDKVKVSKKTFNWAISVFLSAIGSLASFFLLKK